MKLQSDNDAEVQVKTVPRAYNNFADLEEPPGYDSFGSEANDSDYEPSIVSVMPSDENGYTFDQLVDRLVAQPQSKQDTKFIAIFLALYRKFAAPSQLLEAIIKRFEALDHEKHPKMIRTTSQLRHLSIMEQWLSNYPGDFAHPLTKRKMTQFVHRLSHNRIFAVASKEILSDLEVAHEDDDTDWACNDKNRERADQGRSLSVNHVIVAEESEDDSLSKSTTDLSISVTGDSASQKDISSSHFERSGSTTSTSSAGTMLTTIDAARRQAKLLVPIPRAQLTKTQWHLLMGEPEEAIARELTRIDWIMFSSIRPRDLVRHVSLNAAEKKKCKNLDNVDRMIEHFNHLAYWVTNFILLRDKPKHRAMMLEKFMKVARKLRELNNYNSLGAVLAGLNGTAIHRLAATREIIQPQIAKDFMKLEILMSTQKSHFAYRLAWENSSGERIPYLPLHRRDLVSAAEGNATFVAEPSRRPSHNPSIVAKAAAESGADAQAESAAKLQAVLNRTGQQEKEAPPGGIEGRERINWKKFAIMGEVIVGIQRAQGVPYPNIARNDDIKSLVLDLRICKDDDVRLPRVQRTRQLLTGTRNSTTSLLASKRLALRVNNGGDLPTGSGNRDDADFDRRPASAVGISWTLLDTSPELASWTIYIYLVKTCRYDAIYILPLVATTDDGSHHYANQQQVSFWIQATGPEAIDLSFLQSFPYVYSISGRSSSGARVICLSVFRRYHLRSGNKRHPSESTTIIPSSNHSHT